MDVEIRELIEHFGFEVLPVEGTLFASAYRLREDEAAQFVILAACFKNLGLGI